MGSDSMLHNINPADATVNSKKLITGLGSFSARGLGVDDSGTIWVSNVITTVSQPIWTIAIDPVAGTVQATLIGNGTPDLLADLAFVRGSPDSDGDGVLDDDDFCPDDTAIPEGVPTSGVLNPNHWALTDDDGNFDTVTKGKGKGPNRSYTIEDTAGCSCEQIIEIQGLGDGHTKHGCSISAMDDWIEFFVNPQ